MSRQDELCKDCKHFIKGTEVNDNPEANITPRGKDVDRCTKTYYIVRWLTMCITGLFEKK